MLYITSEIIFSNIHDVSSCVTTYTYAFELSFSEGFSNDINTHQKTLHWTFEPVDHLSCKVRIRSVESTYKFLDVSLCDLHLRQMANAYVIRVGRDLTRQR